MDALHTYHAGMFWLQEQLGGDDILHVNFGMAIWLVTVLLRQSRLRDRANLLPLAFLEIANETVDYIDGAGWTAGDTVMDIVLSLMWPVIVTEIARTRSRIRVTKKVRRLPGDADGEPDGWTDQAHVGRRRADGVGERPETARRRTPAG